MNTSHTNTEPTALQVIQSSIEGQTPLGVGSEFAVYALNGFDDAQMNERYVLRVNRDFLPGYHRAVGPGDRQPHSLSDVLKSTTMLTLNPLLFSGRNIGQPVMLLSDNQVPEDIRGEGFDADFSIHLRQPGTSIETLIRDGAQDAIDQGTPKDEALSQSMDHVLTQILKTPGMVEQLYEQVAWLGFKGIGFNDTQPSNFVLDEQRKIGLVDVYSALQFKRDQTPNNIELAKQNVQDFNENFWGGLEDRFGTSDVLEKAEETFNSVQRDMNDKLDALSQQLASGQAIGGELKDKYDWDDAPVFRDTQNTSTHAVRLDDSTKASDLLRTLNSLYTEIDGVGR